MVEGCKGQSYVDRLKTLDLFSLKRRRLRGDLIEAFKILNDRTDVDKSLFFTHAPSSGTRGHSQKLQKEHCRLDCRKYFFSLRVVTCWNHLPESIVSAPSISSFKERLDSAWETLFPAYYP